MQTSNTVGAIQSALVKAREKISNLNPSAKGYSYVYIPLEDVIDHLKQVLPSYGLGYIQLPATGIAGQLGLCTRIIHESGEWIEDTASFDITDMKGVNRSQGAGAALTYFRRYALCAAFGITGDKDTDAVTELEPISVKLGMRPETLQAWETKMALAKDGVELRRIYEQAYEQTNGDKKTIDAIASAKDKRKKELGL